MTSKECVEAANKRLPMICNGIVYGRISKIMKVYDSINSAWYKVELEDVCGSSVA